MPKEIVKRIDVGVARRLVASTPPEKRGVTCGACGGEEFFLGLVNEALLVAGRVKCKQPTMDFVLGHSN